MRDGAATFTREVFILNSAVERKVDTYPPIAKAKFLEVRAMIFEVAQGNELGEVDETLKWGQPAYLCKFGSTIRLEWKPQTPDTIGIFFNCKTVLVETFKEVFGESLNYESNRIVLLSIERDTPQELESCILMALNYHRLKMLPLLGA